MKKITLSVLMVFSCTLFFGFTTDVTSSVKKKSSTVATNQLSNVILHSAGKIRADNFLTESKKFSATIYLYRGPNVSGSWVIEFNGPSGTFTFNIPSGNSTIPSIPNGTYSYVGIHAIGGSSGNYSFSGSACTYSYSTSGTSALFTNVPITCGSGSFSVN